MEDSIDLLRIYNYEVTYYKDKLGYIDNSHRTDLASNILGLEKLLQEERYFFFLKQNIPGCIEVVTLERALSNITIKSIEELYGTTSDYSYIVSLRSIENINDEEEIKKYRTIARAYSKNKELKGGT